MFPIARPSSPATEVSLPSLSDIEAAACVVNQTVPPTAQYRWGQLEQLLGVETWLKHENHGPVGAFKLRGGLTYFDALARQGRLPPAVVCATRGNHGQSVAWAARAHGVPCHIVVPRDNSREKNAAMRALGAHVIEHGRDFQEAREHAQQLAQSLPAHTVPSYHVELVTGVSTYWLELLRAAPQLTHLYVPIGLGSGACAAIAAKLALQHPARVIGVTSARASTYARSLAAGQVVAAEVSTQLADGLAVREADPAALRVLQAHLHDLVEVDDDAVANAMRALFQATHNVAEGAGAAALAGALQQASSLRHAHAVVGLALTGGNVDADVFARVLQAA
ncbi:hypothetical protein CCO03_03420 [Comamonas serinivorans]|uniref:Tryptophan synthase beta chain-like PALP domain-containing protein n=1 Tax=Comamonas serinivorans TaxID=1082851 RepID=A0A1Y0EJU5_9BURK|nr:threonine dehydratase [Comamonas serinivorans]ARU03857.1 hypothetical protein CCO03_03420 [Comamonas serinivorans]